MIAPTLSHAINEAKRFISLAETLIQNNSGEYIEYYSHPKDRQEIRDASIGLSRALAALRNSKL